MTDTNTADTTAALFAAIDSGNEDRVIELINAGADIFATDAEGASTLTHAQRQGNEIIIQTLQMMAEAQGKAFLDAPDDGDAKDAAGEEEPADGTTVLTDSVDVPEIEEGFFVDPAAIVLDKEFKKRWKMLSSPELLHYMARTGDVIAVRDLADRLRRGEDGAFYSPRSAVALYIYAAGKGDIAAMRKLSGCYEFGIGVVPDVREAERWAAAARRCGG